MKLYLKLILLSGVLIPLTVLSMERPALNGPDLFFESYEVYCAVIKYKALEKEEQTLRDALDSLKVTLTTLNTDKTVSPMQRTYQLAVLDGLINHFKYRIIDIMEEKLKINKQLMHSPKARL